MDRDRDRDRTEERQRWRPRLEQRPRHCCLILVSYCLIYLVWRCLVALSCPVLSCVVFVVLSYVVFACLVQHILCSMIVHVFCILSCLGVINMYSDTHAPIKITGKKTINMNFFHYYGCLINLKILTWILYGRTFYLKANLRVLEI